MPIKFTTKGSIELWRGSVLVSKHSIESEAVERATVDYEATGAALYTLKYPNKEIDLSRLTRVIRDVDVTRPTTPTGLAATPTSETQISLIWNASTDPQGAATEAVTGIAGYRLYRNGALRSQQASVGFADTGLTAYTTYSYTVSAYDNAGNESFQSAAIAPRTLDTTAPTAPVISAAATSTTAILVTLATPSTDASSGVASYTLDRATNSGFTTGLVTTSGLTAGQFPRSVTGLTQSTQYFFRVRAVDVAGNTGANSATANATTQSPNLPPVWQSSVDQALTIGVPFSINLDSLCSDPEAQPLTYTIVTGTLPAGLTQSGARGQTISGTPTTAQTLSVTFRANDA